MVDENLVHLFPIAEEKFNEIKENLEQEESTHNSFSYNSVVAGGIFLGTQLVGLFTLCDFIENTLSVSIVLLKKYKGLGIEKAAYDKIVETYGLEFPEKDAFVINVNPSNEDELAIAQSMGLEQTHEFDDLMMNEGGEFYSIFSKENPYSRKRELVMNDKE